ncbi:MAG: hypothetical protein K8S54_03650 [Spirochaetia bacterium]|nr:hypothetical protein [Spirochaetia bacterium]
MQRYLKNSVIGLAMMLVAGCGDNGDAELTKQLKITNCGFARYKGQFGLAYKRYWVNVYNPTKLQAKDIEITWTERGATDTEVATESGKFLEFLNAGQSKNFGKADVADAGALVDELNQSVKATCEVTGIEWVQPNQ